MWNVHRTWNRTYVLFHIRCIPTIRKLPARKLLQKISSNSIRGKSIYRKNLLNYDKNHVKFFNKNISKRNIFWHLIDGNLKLCKKSEPQLLYKIKNIYLNNKKLVFVQPKNFLFDKLKKIRTIRLKISYQNVIFHIKFQE